MVAGAYEGANSHRLNGIIKKIERAAQLQAKLPNELTG